MARKSFFIDQAQAGYLLGVDSRSIQTWSKRITDPLPVAKQGKRGQSNQYDPPELVQWFVRNELTKLNINDGEILDLNTERAKLAKLQAAKVQLDIDEREANLVAPDELLELFSRMIMGTRSHFLAMPSRWAPMLVNIKTVPEMFEQLQDAVYQSLTEMADRPVQELLKMTEGETNG